MLTIRELLARRTDLSTFVVHLTRKFKNVAAPGNLKSILKSGRIEARSSFGSAVDLLKKRGCPAEDYESQKCVCFTETPLEHFTCCSRRLRT